MKIGLIIFLVILILFSLSGCCLFPSALFPSANNYSTTSESETIEEFVSATTTTNNKVNNVQDSTTVLEKTNNQIAEPIVLAGTGNQSTDFFNILGVYTLLYFDGSGFFNPINVDLMDEVGNKVQNLNTIISTNFSKILLIQKGKYFLNVEAEDSWRVTITQHLPKVKNLPYIFVGDSQNLSDLIVIDRLAEIKYSYSGSGNFIVQLTDEYGQDAQLLVNEVDSTTGSTTFTGSGSKYLISAERATGKYVIDIDYK